MNSVQERICELEKYKPKLTKRPDFESFWEMGLEELIPRGSIFRWKIDHEAQKIEKDEEPSFELKLEPFNYPIKQVKVYKAALEAADGTIIKGWYLKPSQAEESNPVPGLVRFHGYSSNKGKVCELLLWALQGYAILGMDVRGQCGDTPDTRTYSSGSFAGWLTQGIESPLEYYYRQVYLDSVQLTEALARRPEVDNNRLGLFGNSQGAALAIACTAILTKFKKSFKEITANIVAVNAGIPFLADIKKAFYENHSEGPWAEFDWFFRMQDPLHEKENEIFENLSYFDVMNFAPWVKCPTLVSVALQDKACPPATIYALYNHLAGEKEIIPYADYSHESIDVHVDRQIEFFAEKLLFNNL